MTWEIEIVGDKSDLEELSKVFKEDVLSIKQENEHFILKSVDFDILSDYNEVETKAIELLKLVNACAKLVLDSRKDIKHESITRSNENGTRDMFIKTETCVMNVSCKASCQIIRSDGSIEIYNQATPAVNWMKVAQRDNMVKKALNQIHGDNNSWDTFYKISEILKDDGYDKIMPGGIYNKKVKLLRRTANHYRHSNYPLPPNELSLLQAKSFIKVVLREWLNDKENKWLKTNGVEQGGE